MPVKKIATDLGVSRNAVYLQIERLRERGVLPRDYTPSRPATAGAAPGADAGPRARRGRARARLRRGPLTGLCAPSSRSSGAAPATKPAGGEYARMIEAAAARSDAVALAYELGRLDATEAEELATGSWSPRSSDSDTCRPPTDG